MKAVYYDRFGPAEDVLHTGEVPTPDPAAGEVRVRLRASAVNPSDVKLRSGARPGAVMAFPRIIPHSDGAGVIDAVGPGGDPDRIGQRVWVWNGQWQRPLGTAAEAIALPSHCAVALPDKASFENGACLGIPAMTAWYALFGDGVSLAGQTVLITGGAGSVGRYAVQMARLAGAKVIATVSSPEKARHALADATINYRTENVVEAVLDMTNGAGVDRVVDVDFGANQDTSLPLIKEGGVISAYASAAKMEPHLQFYPFMFKNVTLRMLIAYLIPPAAHRRGEAALAEWLDNDALQHAVVPGGALDNAAKAHDLVAAGDKLGTVVLSI